MKKESENGHINTPIYDGVIPTGIKIDKNNMKIHLSILLCLLFGGVVFGQSESPQKESKAALTSPVYRNEQYKFSVTTPDNSVLDQENNDLMEFLVTYSCVDTCAVPGLFSISSIKPVNYKLPEVVKLFQTKGFQDGIAQVLVDGFDPDMKATVTSKTYAAYNGRPVFRVDFHYVQDEMSFNGTMLQMFIDERKIVVTFAIVAPDEAAAKWRAIGEKAVRTLTVDKVSGGVPAKKPDVLRDGKRQS